VNEKTPPATRPTEATPGEAQLESEVKGPLATRLGEIAGVFTLLGFTAFGGPAAHISMIEDQVVTRRNWLTRKHLLDIISAINFIPGPNSTELVMHLGYLRAGMAGLVVAGACFITPAVLIILPIAWAYISYGALPRVAGVMAMISCAVVAIVAVAAWRFATPLARQPQSMAIALACAVMAILLGRYTRLQPELVILAFAGLSGIVIGEFARARSMFRAIAPLPLSAMMSMHAAVPEYVRGMGSLCLFLLKVGATLFGSGYVLVSYLRSGLVIDLKWLTEQQLLDAIAVGQFTPGPLLTTATFVGYLLGEGRFGGGHVGGVAGAVLATLAIFLPSFILVALVGPVMQRLRDNRIARNSLDGMNAAVAALLILVCVQLGVASINAGGLAGAAVMAAAGVMLAFKLNATWVILGAICVGMLLPG